MLWQYFAEYLYFLTITGFIFYLFFFLLTLFGFIFFNFIKRRFFRIKHKFGLLETIFISFGIGFVIYISYSLILLTFEIFNFFFAYLPLVLIDSFYIIYLYFKKRKRLDLSKFFKNKKKFERKKWYLFSCFFVSMLFLLSLQITLQFQDITKYLELISKDSYSNLENLYYLLDNKTIDLNRIHFIYPQGFIIFCSGALQISNNYLIAYFFLKFGGIFVLSLFTINIFQITQKIFKKFSISLICSLLLLSNYFYIIRINAFLSGSFAILFVSLSLNVFFNDKKFLYFIGFFIPSIFFLNPSVCLYFLLLIFCFIILFLVFLDRKSFKLYLGVILISSLIFSCLFLPHLLLLSKYNYYLTDLFKLYFNSLFRFSAQITKIIIPFNSFFITIFQETTGLIQSFIDFFFNGTLLKEFNVAFNTILIFSIFVSFGFIKRSSKNVEVSDKTIHLICKIAILIIGTLYFLIIFASEFIAPFILLYADRIFEIFYPFIILLCGFGIEYLMNLTRKIIKYLKERRIYVIRFFKDNRITLFISKKKENLFNLQRKTNSLKTKTRFKTKNLKISFKNSFKLKYLFVFLLTAIILSNLLSQTELKENFRRHYYDDYTIESYLYLRSTIPKDSNILIPNFTNDNYLINKILFDMDIYITNTTISLSFIEFESFVKTKSINFLMLNKTVCTPIILNNLSIHTNYEIIFDNKQYSIYKVI